MGGWLEDKERMQRPLSPHTYMEDERPQTCPFPGPGPWWACGCCSQVTFIPLTVPAPQGAPGDPEQHTLGVTYSFQSSSPVIGHEDLRAIFWVPSLP